MSMLSLGDCKERENEKQDETKEEKIDVGDEAYNKKFEEMQNYLPFLEKMIQKLENSKKDTDFRKAQLLKMRSLHRILFTSKRKLKMETLIKCESVLRNLQEKLKGCFLQEKEDIQKTADENNSEKDSEVVNTDSGEHRTVILAADGNITIDTHYHWNGDKKQTDKRSDTDNRNEERKQDDKKNEQKKNLDYKKNCDIGVRICEKKDIGEVKDVSVTVINSLTQRKDNIEKTYIKLNKPEEKERQTTVETGNRKVTFVLDQTKRDKNTADYIKKSKRQLEWDSYDSVDASFKPTYMSKKESNYQKCSTFGYIWEDRKDLELSRRKLKSLIEQQNQPSESAEHNLMPELSTEGLLKINYRSRFVDNKHRPSPEVQSERYDKEDVSSSRSLLESSHISSSDESLLSVCQGISENRPIPGLQNYIPKEGVSDKKALNVEHDITQEDKFVGHSVGNVNVSKHLGARSENAREVKPQQSLRAKLKEEISTVHKVGTACGGALRGLINKDDKSLSTSRILSLKTGALIDLLGKNKTSSSKPTKPKLIREKHRVQEDRTNDSEKQGKTMGSVCVSNFHSSSNNSTSISNPSAIISNLSQEDLEKLINENVKNLPSPPPIILESVRAKVPSFGNKDGIQKQNIASDVVKSIPSASDSIPFHSICQPLTNVTSVYHPSTLSVAHQEIDRSRGLPQEMPSSSAYMIQSQGQQNSINSKGVYLPTVNMTLRHQQMLNPVTPLNTDIQYQFSPPQQQQQQQHTMNVQHQHSLFISHQGMVSGHQQVQNIQRSPQMYAMSPPPQVHMPTSSQMHTVSPSPQIHVMSPLQSPPVIHDSIPCHVVSNSGYSNQSSEGWVSKFDQDRRNLNTFQRRSESHIGRVEPFKWGHHASQSNYVDSPPVQSSHGYYSTSKQTNVHHTQQTETRVHHIGAETRVNSDQRSVTSLHRGLSARDPRRRSIEEMIGHPQSSSRNTSRCDQSRGRDPRLTSGKYNKEDSAKNRDPRIKTVSFKAKHNLTLTKSKPRSDVGDKLKERIVSSPLEKLYSTNVKEVTGKGYGPQRYKIPKIKRVDKTMEQNHDVKDKQTCRSEEKVEGGKFRSDSKFSNSSSKTLKTDTKKEGEQKDAIKSVRTTRVDKDRDSRESSTYVKSEEESSSEEENKNSRVRNEKGSVVVKYKHTDECKKEDTKTIEKSAVIKKAEDESTEPQSKSEKSEDRGRSDNFKADKNIKAEKPDTKDDNLKADKPSREDHFKEKADKPSREDHFKEKADKPSREDNFKEKAGKPIREDHFKEKAGKPSREDHFKDDKPGIEDHFKADEPDTKEDHFEADKPSTKEICNRSDIIETLISNKSLESDEKKKLLKKLEETLPDKKFKKILKIIESSSDDESNGDDMKTVEMEENAETEKSVEAEKREITDVNEDNRSENDKSNESDANETAKEIGSKKVKKYTKKKSVKTDKKSVKDNTASKHSQEIECTEDLISSKILENTVSDISDRPKRKQKNELEKLQEDIRDMFISKGVVAATGMRMCRLQRESTSSVSNASTNSLSGKEPLIPNLRSSKHGKLERQRGLKETKNGKEKMGSHLDESSDYNTSDEELLETIHKNLKSRPHITDAVDENVEKECESTHISEEKPDDKNSEVNTTLKVPENMGSPRIILKKTDLTKFGNVSSADADSPVKILSSEESESQSPHKPVARYKIFKGRKKANWKLGIIHKKGKPKTHQNKGKVTDEVEIVNVEIKEENIGNRVDYLDVQYYQGKVKKYNCKLCAYEGKAIVHHYLVCHPGEEVMISRLSPESAADAIKGSVQIGCYDDAVSKLSDRFQCRMCVRNFPSILSFYEHITMHTGEYRHECLKCGYRTSTRKGIRYHVKTSHPETRKGEIHFRIVHEVSAKEKVLVGYLCSGCNFVQLRENNLKKHILEKHLADEPKIIAINLSKQKLKDDQQKEDETMENDQTIEIKQEIKYEVKTDDETGETNENVENSAMDVDTNDMEEAEVENDSVVKKDVQSKHEPQPQNACQNEETLLRGASIINMQKADHSQENSEDSSDKILNESDPEKGWRDLEIKKELEINIVDVDSKSSNSASTFTACNSIKNESSVQKKLKTKDSNTNAPEELPADTGNKLNKVDQVSVFLCSEDFTRYEDSVRLERQLTMQEIARSINANDKKDRNTSLLDQVWEKLHTRHKEDVDKECSENGDMVETNSTSKLPVKLPSPVVEEEVQSSDNVRTRRSLPERSCKEKALKNTEKICSNETDSLSDTTDLSDFKEYLQDMASPAESEVEITDVKEITASVDNMDRDEVTGKNLCLKNTVSQLTETLKSSKVREFLFDDEFSDVGELWLYKVKNLPNHSWKLVMDEIKCIIGSVDFRNACGCTSSVPLVVGPLESYCPNECWFFKCNVQNCSFTTSVASSFAEHIECNHICTTWNGVCTLCKTIYCVESETKSSYHLASAFLHLLKDHFVELINIPVDEPEKKTEDCQESSETTADSSESSFIPISQESAHKMPHQVHIRPFTGPILRVRRLSGDKLSVTPAEKMKKSVDESKSDNQGECKPAVSEQPGEEGEEEEGCSFLKIESVVSLNPQANTQKSDDVLQPPGSTEVVSSPASPSKPAFISTDVQSKVQTIASPRTVTLLSTRPIYKSFKLPSNQKITKQLPVNQILVPIRPKHNSALSPNTQFVSNQLLGCKILNITGQQGIDIRTPGPFIYPIVTTVSPQVSPNSKTNQPTVSSLSPQQIQAVLQCVQQQKQTDQSSGKKDTKSPDVTVSPRNSILNQRTSLLPKDFTDEVSKSILQYKDPAAYREMLLYKNIIRFYKCMSYDCSFSTPCGKAFVSHLEKHKTEDESKGVPDDKRHWTKCAYCLNTFKAAKEYCIHLRKEHGQSNIQCAYCFYRSVALANVAFHQKVSHKTEPLSLLKCTMTDNIPPRTKGLNVHAFVKPVICAQGQCCYRTYLFDVFETHFKTHHKQESFLACYICKLHMFGTGQLFRHFKEEHQINEFQCLHCLFGAEKEDSIRYHLCTAHADYEPAAVARVKACAESGFDRAEQLKRVMFVEEIDTKCIWSAPPPLVDISIEMSQLSCTKPGVAAQKPVSADSDTKSADERTVAITDSMLMVHESKGRDDSDKVPESDPLSIEETEVCKEQEKHTAVPSDSTEGLLNISSKTVGTASDVDIDLSMEADVKEEEDETCSEAAEKGSADKTSESVTDEAASNSDVSNNTETLKRTRTKSYITGLKGKDLYWCAYEGCKFRGNDSAELKSHLQTCERAQYASVLKCAHCPKMLKTLSNLLEHLRTHGPLRYMCSLCDFKDSVQSRITSHMKQVHKVSSTNPVPLNLMEKNSEHAQFVLVPKEKGAQKLFFQVKKENSQMKIAYSPNEINEIPLASVFPRPLKCSLCKYASKVRTNLLIHLNLHLESAAEECNVPDAEVVNPVPCLDKKEMMFDKMMNLASSSHKNIPKAGKTEVKKEGVVDTNDLPKFVPVNQRYVCSAADCTYRTISESMLRYHIRSLHNNQSQYRCPHCPESSTACLVGIDRIAAHMKLHDSQLYKCSHCSYHHYTRHVVERHVTEKHPEKRPFVIVVRERDPEAGSSSETDTKEGIVNAQPAADTHGISKTASKQIHCKLCKFRAGTEEDMKTHCGNVHGIKSQFKCGLCAFTSDDDGDFDAHFAENHDKLPTQIVSLYEKVEEIPLVPISSDGLCEASTSAALLGDSTPLWQRGVNRVRHIRGIFIDEEGTAQAPIATPTLEQITNKIGPEDELFPPYGFPAPGSLYVCPVCTKYKTKEASSMKSHLYKEQNYKPWLCTVCGVTTISRIQAVKHLSKTHTREAKETPDSFIMYCPEPECEKWVDGVLDTQLNLMMSVNDNAGIQSGEDVRRLSKTKTPPTNRKRRTLSSESVGFNDESPPKQVKKRQKSVPKVKELETSITKGRYCCGYCTLSTDHKAILKLHHQKMHSSLQESIMHMEASNNEIEEVDAKDPLEGPSTYLEADEGCSPGSGIPKAKGRKNKFTKCVYCNFTAPTVSMVKNHWRSVHKFKQYSAPNNLQPCTGVKFLYKTIVFDSEELYECRWCKITGRMIELQEHHQLLHPEHQFHVISINIPKYKCSECSTVVNSVSEITKHFLDAHGKEASYFILDTKQDTKRQDTVLSSDKRYQCPLCMSTFNAHSAAVSHLQVHSEIHKCFYCDEDFMDLSEGYRHMEFKHRGLEPQFHVVKLSEKDIQIIKESITAVSQNESELVNSQDEKFEEFTYIESEKQSVGQKRQLLFNDVVLPKKIKQTARKSTTPHQKRYIHCSTTFWPEVQDSSKSHKVPSSEEFIIPDIDRSREPQSDKRHASRSQHQSSTQEPFVTIELSDSDESTM